jgi:hypothetical protein
MAPQMRFSFRRYLTAPDRINLISRLTGRRQTLFHR